VPVFILQSQYKQYLRKKYFTDDSGLGRSYDEYKTELGEITGNGQLSDRQRLVLKKLDEYVQGLYILLMGGNLFSTLHPLKEIGLITLVLAFVIVISFA